CLLGSTALYGPPALTVFPPKAAVFSTRITSAPLSAAETAAASPAPPPPITTTSVSILTASSSVPEVETFLSASASPPASSTALETASIIALEVIVAPLIVSTPNDCDSTI